MRNAGIVITVTRQGFDTLTLTFDSEPTKAEVIAKSGWTLAASEKFFVNGEEALEGAVFEHDDTIQIVGKKEGGLK